MSMRYYHDTDDPNNDDYNLDDFQSRSMFDDVMDTFGMNKNDYDPEYDKEVNRLLEEAEKDFLVDESETKDEKISNNFDNSTREKYEDYYDEFSENDNDDEDIVPKEYTKLIEAKIKDAKSRLETLSTMICYTCTNNLTRNQIMRMEKDHNSPFCKFDYPKHPSFNKPWQNYWKFNCILKCKVKADPFHVHTASCEELSLEHVDTGITTKTADINRHEFPHYIMHAVELFQEFATDTQNKSSYLVRNKKSYNNSYEKPTWMYIKLRCNYKEEIMLIVCGKDIISLISPLRKFFSHGPGRSCNVVSLYCINSKKLKKSGQLFPTFVTGCLDLRDKIGPIIINYNPKSNISFNSAQAHLLGKVMLEYLSPNVETTFIDLGCNYGVLSLMLANKCDKVIGLYTLEHQIKLAEEIKSDNNIYNASFIVCNPKEIHTKCSSLIKKCSTIAALNLASPYGKSFDAIKALRNLPSIWRIAIYGSFVKDFFKYIAILTDKNESIGDEFLPMQGRIIDKSPTDANEYDIVVLFERKALIETKIKPISSGPTLNVKTEIKSLKNNDEPKRKPALKAEKSVDYLSSKDYRNNSFSSGHSGTSPDHTPKAIAKANSLPRSSNNDEPKRKSSINHSSNKNLNNYSSSSRSRSSTSVTQHSRIKKDPYNPYSIEMWDSQVFLDSPLLPDSTKSQQLKFNVKPNCSPNVPEKVRDSRRRIDAKGWKEEKEDDECSPPIIVASIPSVFAARPVSTYSDYESSTNHERSIKYEEEEERPSEIETNDAARCKILKKNRSLSPAVEILRPEPSSPEVIIKTEPMSPPRIIVKTEPLSPPRIIVKTEKLSPPRVIVKTEPPSPPRVIVKTEAASPPGNMREPETPSSPENIVKTKPPSAPGNIIKTDRPLSPPRKVLKTEPGGSTTSAIESPLLSDLEYFENMKTPLIKPARLAATAKSTQRNLDSAKFTTVDGFQLSVKSNESFLSKTKSPETNEQLAERKPTELVESAKLPITSVKREEDDANEIGLKKEKAKNSTADGVVVDVEGGAVAVKIEGKDVTVKKEKRKSSNKVPKDENKDNIDLHLMTLIEKRKSIQRQLERDRDYKCRSDRSMSPTSSRYNRSSISPRDRGSRLSLLPRYRSSRSPNKFYDRRCRSPSPPKRTFDKRCLSPPIPIKYPERRARSPVSPYGLFSRRYTSPTPPNRFSGRRGRSPSPSNRFIDRRGRSPSPPNRFIDRRGRSPSPPNRFIDRRGRSPSPPNRFIDRRGRSPLSSNRFNDRRSRSPLSPNRFMNRRARSPFSPNRLISRR